MTDIRTSIVSALKAQLETITTANGYNNTVGDVVLGDVGFQDVSSSNSPLIGLIFNTCRTTPAHGGFDCEWDFQVLGFKILASDDIDNHSDEAHQLRRDIRKAIVEKPDLGISWSGFTGVRQVLPTQDDGTGTHKQAAAGKIVAVVQQGVVIFEEDQDA